MSIASRVFRYSARRASRSSMEREALAGCHPPSMIHPTQRAVSAKQGMVGPLGRRGFLRIHVFSRAAPFAG